MVTNKFIIKIMLALFGNLANGIQENETFSVGGEIAGLIAQLYNMVTWIQSTNLLKKSYHLDRSAMKKKAELKKTF